MQLKMRCSRAWSRAIAAIFTDGWTTDSKQQHGVQLLELELFGRILEGNDDEFCACAATPQFQTMWAAKWRKSTYFRLAPPNQDHPVHPHPNIMLFATNSPPDRKSVVKGKTEAVSVDLGGRRRQKKKKN